MKNLYIIGGPMGVGKTATGQNLKAKLPNSVFLDGDWCWDMHPFQITEETKDMVIENICYMLNNFIKCSAFDNIIFCWVLHQQNIIDRILSELNTAECRCVILSLVCSEEVLEKRLRGDIAKGYRSIDVIERSKKRIPMYDAVNSIKIDTSEKTIQEITEIISGI